VGLRSWVGSVLRPLVSDPAQDERYWTQMESGGVSVAGVRVSAETAMRVSAVYRCVSIIANSGALLPGGVYQRLERGRREVPTHPVRRLLWKIPNPFQRPFEFKRVMFAWAILRGSAYARIYRKPDGSVELWPLHPDRVRGPEMMEDGRRRYYYRRPDTNTEDAYLADLDILVVNGLSLDGIRGLALSDLARDSIGLAQATEQFGATLFGRGAMFSGALQLPLGKTIVSSKARDDIRQSIREQGAGPGRWHGMPIFEDGMEWKNISMTNDDAQFLETRKFSITDIARWFGVPPHMIGDVERSTSWGTGIEQQSIGFVTYGLMPWLALFEQCFEAALIAEEDYYLRFNVAGLLRADVKTRFEVHDIAIRNGIHSPNDCREIEDENPREGGDVYVTPTAPQQSPRTEPKAGGEDDAEGAPDDEPPEDGDPNAMAKEPLNIDTVFDTPEFDPNAAALIAKVWALEQKLAQVEEQIPKRTSALAQLRTSSAELGIPTEAVRKLVAQARKGDAHVGQ
jgi:HK97 family phage portal protein